MLLLNERPESYRRAIESLRASGAIEMNTGIKSLLFKRQMLSLDWELPLSQKNEMQKPQIA